MSLRKRALLTQLAFFAGFAGIWEVATRYGGVDRDVLPPFTEVLATLMTLKDDTAFLTNASVTVVRVAAAFAIGAPLAILAGFVVGERAALHRRLAGPLHFLLAVPQSMLLPMFILVFGVGSVQKIVFGVTHIFFVLILTTIAAVRSVPANLSQAAQSFGASRMQLYLKIYFPAMLPLLVEGARMALIFDVIGVLLAEMYASQTGLGLLIMRWGEDYNVRKLMAAVLLISILTIAVNEMMRLWESRLEVGRNGGERR